MKRSGGFQLVRRLFFDTVSGNRPSFPDSNMMRVGAVATLAQRGEDLGWGRSGCRRGIRVHEREILCTKCTNFHQETQRKIPSRPFVPLVDNSVGVFGGWLLCNAPKGA